MKLLQYLSRYAANSNYTVLTSPLYSSSLNVETYCFYFLFHFQTNRDKKMLLRDNLFGLNSYGFELSLSTSHGNINHPEK